jgi:riboflavin synthase alpha subunit
MPVSTEVRGEVRHDHHMSDTGFDPRLASRAYVGLARAVRLNRVDGHLVEGHPKNPHATAASVTTMNTTTNAMSVADRFCSRNGLKPMRTT